MANTNRRSGTIYLRIDGTQYDARGSFTYSLGPPKREAIVGPDGVHGYKEMPQVPYIEGEIVDSRDLDLAALQGVTESTVTLEPRDGQERGGARCVVRGRRDGGHRGRQRPGPVRGLERGGDFLIIGLSRAA